jgi:AcrR family transcriptional regulator
VRGSFASAENGVAHERVSEIQRARIIAAMFDVVAEQGAPGASVAHVVARAGISRRTFYEIFDDRDDCFLAAFEDAVERASTYVSGAYDPRAPWRERVRNGLVALLEFFDGQPKLARLLVCDSLAAGPGALEYRNRVLTRLMGVVDGGRAESKSQREVPPLTAEGVVGAVGSLLHTRLAEREQSRSKQAPLVELAGSLMGIVVLPYLGPAAARIEIERPIPERSSADPRPIVGDDPLCELRMRLTYRTIRVLIAVASSPGLSNRAVADAAGISDQGQMSKLLGRLLRVGLIENTVDGHARGEANAWRLTPEGARVEHSLRARTPEHDEASA